MSSSATSDSLIRWYTRSAGLPWKKSSINPLSRERRTATVTALKSTDLLVLDCDDFHRFIDRNPDIGAVVRDVAQDRAAAPVARSS